MIMTIFIDTTNFERSTIYNLIFNNEHLYNDVEYITINDTKLFKNHIRGVLSYEVITDPVFLMTADDNLLSVGHVVIFNTAFNLDMYDYLFPLYDIQNDNGNSIGDYMRGVMNANNNDMIKALLSLIKKHVVLGKSLYEPSIPVIFSLINLFDIEINRLKLHEWRN